MKTLRLSLTAITACGLLVGSAILTARSPSAAAPGAHDPSVLRALEQAHTAQASAADDSHLSHLTRRELAQVRRATAKYHDISNAEADGYVNVNSYTSGEGYHYVNALLIDTTFNHEQPEVLLYTKRGDGAGLKLVAVEYVSLDTAPAPAGFTGDADVWQSEPPFPFWVVNAWVWVCALDDQSSCPRTSPHRLARSEVHAIGDMVTSPKYRHVPTGTLAVHAQRLGTVCASPSTWYRLVRKYGWRPAPRASGEAKGRAPHDAS